MGYNIYRPVLETELSEEELMRESLDDLVKKSVLNLPGFIEDKISELKRHLDSGGNYFEFFYNISNEEAMLAPTKRSTVNNSPHWRAWRLRDIQKKNNCTAEEALAIFNKNIEDKKSKKENKTRLLEAEHDALMRKRIKTAQLYAEYDFKTYPDSTACIVFEIDTGKHKEYMSHKEAAKDIGASLSNVVICHRQRSIIKKKYGVLILKGIKEHKHLEQEQD